MWLRDKLPQEVPGIRVFLYGYDSRILSESFQTLDDLAQDFITSLRPFQSNDKPFAFVAHSLGGLVLKQALSRAVDELAWVLDNTQLAILFGVPHKGMHNSHLLSMVKSNPSKELITLLDPESGRLEILDEEFSKRANQIRIVSAYETHRSRIVVSSFSRRSDSRSRMVIDGSRTAHGKSSLPNNPQSLL
jgi:hypothetical protein